MNLIEDAKSVLNDAKCYLKQIRKQDYTQSIQLLSFSTIGQHTRHFIEFFQCLIHQSANRNINYCNRARDMKIETDPDFAIETIEWIIQHLNDTDLNKEVKLFSGTDKNNFIVSNIAREIHYNIEHTIHHLALLKIGLNFQCQDLEIPDNFGVAASTIKHRNSIVHAD